MPVPNTIADLNQAAASNTPLGTDTVGPSLDDYLRAGFAFTRQLFDGTPHYLTSVAGTDTITANSPVPFTAYVIGQTFRFVPAGSNTSTTVTLNINGIGAGNVIKSSGAPLQIGDLVAGRVYQVTFVSNQWRLETIPNGALLNVQVFTATAVYTPTPGTGMVIVKQVGGGGGGGGVPGTGAGQVAPAQGGGAGAYAEALIRAAFAGVTVTIGAGGAGGAAGVNAGVNGGITSFGALVLCPGGNGGNSVTAQTPPTVITGAVITAAPTINAGATALVAQAGIAGGYGQGPSAGIIIGGAGAQSPWGTGWVSGNGAGPGANAGGFGAGGSGAAAANGSGAVAGGKGSDGRVVVWEFA